MSHIIGLETESVRTEVRLYSAHFAKDAFYILHGTKQLQPSALPSKGSTNSMPAVPGSRIVTKKIKKSNECESRTRVETMKTAMTLLTNINPGPPRVPQTPLLPKTIVSMAKDLENL